LDGKMQTRPKSLKRRKFLKLAASTAAIASIPVGIFADEGNPSAKEFGGPTPNRDFYITSYASTPSVDRHTWTLRIHGLVERPLTVSYDNIRQRPAIVRTLTLECVSNPPDGSAISNARWTGSELKPLLDQARIQSAAVWAVMRAADGYYTGVPLKEIIRPENWLVYLMNGEPLPPAHGYPVRIFIPGKYGMKQPKWLTEIEFVDREFTGYWEARGWSNEAWRKVNSGFFYPRPSGGILDILSLSSAAKVTAPVDIRGWALGGPSGIKRVEISTDGGSSWQDARILKNESPYIWTVWGYRFAPKRSGDYEIRVRATDGNGISQPERDPQMGAGMSGQPRMKLRILRS
jgi:DMSO/TMAO reductase YedYZ molybdopterin-dependent catalytic subunit